MLPKQHPAFLVAAILTALTPAVGLAADPTAENLAFFENRVRPLLVQSCSKCHGAKKQEAGLRLDSREMLLKGGESGPALIPGDPRKSLLIRAVQHQGDLKMPPSKKLSTEQIAALTRWVERGAAWPTEAAVASVRGGPPTAAERRFWSFQPIARPAVPAVADSSWPRTDIDRFILARLEAKGLKPALAAEKRALIRRANFDLIGLSPTPHEIDAFLADHSPSAFAKVVDRLLASPHYGERWGRHWLDVVRYADTAGETADFPSPLAYRYRNWVIDAINADKPYDEFIREQIAGDLLAAKGPSDRYADRVIATGFLAISRRFGFDPENYHHLTIQDTIDTLGQAVLGLTLGCARCHDHKFDPVSRADYYGLYGIFDSTRYAFPGSEQKQRPYDLVPLLPRHDAEGMKARFDAAMKTLSAEIKALEADKVAGKNPPTTQRLLADKQNRLAELSRQGQPYAVAFGVVDGTPHNARIHKRGEPTDPGDEVPRRFLDVLGGDTVAPTSGSGRMELANWLTRSENPLTARVMVNRVWQYHFGIGLVASPNDFGTRGRLPTHPELLDYLAGRFRAEGWSLKALHRQIVLSQVYQTSTQADAYAASNDPDNQFLAHARRHRLDAESLRDTLLTLGGRLDPSPGPAHPFPPMDQWRYTQHAPFLADYPSNRRSVYLMTPRLRRHPYLALFDGADPNASTPLRNLTTVPTQALYMMNDPFVHEMATGLATRLLALGTDEPSRVSLAYQMAFGRPPRPEEFSEASQFLAAYRVQLQAERIAADSVERTAWAAFNRTLFARNEFVVVD